MKKLLLLFFLCLLIDFSSFCNSDSLLIKGWDAFNRNDRKAARNCFLKATEEKSTAEEAWLSLCFVSMSEAKNEEAFDFFNRFFRISPNPYPYLYALWYSDALTYGYSAKKDAKRIALYNQIIADKRANGTMKALAYAALGNHYQQVWDFANADKAFDQIGMSYKWLLTGVFDNFSESGFNKNYPPVTTPESNAEFVNKNNAPVRWFKVAANRRDKWLDMVYHFDIRNAIIYAQTFVYCPENRELVARTGVSGSVKLWVNDLLIFSEDEERNTDLDIYNYKVKLNKGYNRILIQLGSSEINKCNFLFRMTDDEGVVYKDLIYSDDYQPYKKSEEYEPVNLPVFAEAYFEEKVKNEPDKLLNYLFLSETYLKNEKKFNAKKILTKARKLAPGNSLIVERQIELSLRSYNRTDFSKEVEWLKANDPDNPLAIQYAINEAAEKEDNKALRDLITKYETLLGETQEVLRIKLNHKSVLNLTDKGKSLIDLAYQKYPDNYQFVNAKYQNEKSSNGPAKAIQILEKYLKNNFNVQAMVALANAWFSLGNDKKGFDTYFKLINAAPYSTGYYDAVSKLYKSKGNYAKAHEWALKTLQMAPFIATYFNNVGSIYELEGSTSKAVEAYSKALLYEPYYFDMRKKIRELTGQPEPFSNFENSDVYALYHKAPGKEAFPDDHSLVILNSKKTVVYAEGASEEKITLLAKVLSNTGIETWKEYAVPVNTSAQRLIIEKAEVIKANGNRVAADVKNNYIVFTSLEPNDGIHISYSIQNFQTGKLFNHYWDNFGFDFFVPCMNSSYELLIHKNHQLQYKVINGSILPKKEEMNDFVKYTWKAENLDKIKDEIYMPPYSDVAQILHLSTIPNWSFISSWYADVAMAKTKAGYEVKELVDSLFQTDSVYTEFQKAKMIYDYVVKNIQYSSVSFRQSGFVPQDAATTLNTKLGDCKDVSVLFVALAKQIGLKANLVLVLNRGNGEQDIQLPSVEFDHCIARAIIDGKEHFIELTSDLLSFNTMANYLYRSTALNIPVDGIVSVDTIFKLPSENANTNYTYRKSVIKFDKNNLVITRSNKRTGLAAANMRYYFRSLSPEKQKEDMSHSISVDYNTPVKVETLFFKNLDKLEDTLEYTYTFTISNIVTKVAGMSIFKLPWSDMNYLNDVMSVGKRVHALHLWELLTDQIMEEDLELELPENMKMVENPVNFKASCHAMDYEILFRTENKRLFAKRRLTLKNDVVPADEFEETRKIIEEISQNDHKQYAVK